MTEEKKKRAPFGGVTVCFAGQENTALGFVFGSEPMSPGVMARKLWAFIKDRGLTNKAKTE